MYNSTFYCTAFICILQGTQMVCPITGYCSRVWWMLCSCGLSRKRSRTWIYGISRWNRNMLKNMDLIVKRLHISLCFHSNRNRDISHVNLLFPCSKHSSNWFENQHLFLWQQTWNLSGKYRNELVHWDSGNKKSTTQL